MKLGIVTDSTSDLPKYLIEQYELEVVPSILIIEGKEYADGIGISREEFYRRLPSFQTQPTTAAASTRRRLQVFAAFDTLEYAKRSGRLPAAFATIGGLLNIKPFIELRNGEVKPSGVARTTKQANEKLMSLLLEGGPLEKLAILHTGAEPRAKEFLNMVMQKASQSVPRDILMVNVTTVIGTHVGPNGLGFAAVGE